MSTLLRFLPPSAWRVLLLLALLGGLFALTVASGQPAPVQPAAAANKKTYYVSFADMPWRKALDWLAGQTNLQIATTAIPLGTFSFTPPKGADGKPVKYSMPEVIDIFNEALHKENWTILRTNNCLYLWPASDKIPNLMIPQITRKELDDRGKTEWVSLLAPVKNANAATVAAAQKIVGPQGEIVAVPQIHQVWIKGRAGDVKKALQVLD